MAVPLERLENIRTVVGTSREAEPSTTAEMSTLSAAIEAQGVQPRSTCRSVPGCGK